MTLILLAAAFGTDHKADRPGNDYHTRSKTSPSLLGKPQGAAAALWDSVAEVITRRWRYALRTFGSSGLAKHTREMGAIANLLSIDLKPMAAAAEKAIPEPKSWAKLKPDTKSTAKPKAKKVSACRVCGCTETTPCTTAFGPCSWIDPTLCSNPKCVEAAIGTPNAGRPAKAPRKAKATPA